MLIRSESRVLSPSPHVSAATRCNELSLASAPRTAPRTRQCLAAFAARRQNIDGVHDDVYLADEHLDPYKITL